jgi:hypothetical protein
MENQDRREQRRLETHRRLAYGVAQRVSAEIEARHGKPGAVRFLDDSAFTAFNQAYWDAVSHFKREHGFPDDGRINSPKKAALAVACALWSPAPLFAATLTGLDISHEQYCLTRFCIELMKMHLNIDEDRIPRAHIRDMVTCFNILRDLPEGQRSAARHLLCLYMDSLFLTTKPGQ